MIRDVNEIILIILLLDKSENISMPQQSVVESFLKSESVEYVRSLDRDHFFCSLFIPKECRYNYLILYALNIEINNILYFANEEMVALIRLKWWREKVEEIYDGKRNYNHYLLDDLTRIIKSSNIPLKLFNKYFDGYEKMICKEKFVNIIDLEKTIEDTTINLLKMIFIAIGNNEKQFEKVIYHAGISWGLMNSLRNERNYNKKNRSFLPMDLLEESGIPTIHIKEKKYKLVISEIVKVILRRAESHIDQVKILSKNLPKKTYGILLETKLADLYLQQIRKNNFDIFGKKIGKISAVMQIKLLLNYTKNCL